MVSLRGRGDAADHRAHVASRSTPRAALGALLAALSIACAPAAADASTYVDGASTGGACSDARTAAQAASPATPWCSLVTAAMKAPSGSSVLVRGGSYPYTRIDGAGRTAATATITMKAYPGETPVVAAVDIRNFSHLRFEGLRFSGTMSLVYFGNDHIEFVGNDLTNAVNIRGSRTSSSTATTSTTAPTRAPSTRARPAACGR